jgi:Raf kinase inhibitor-like YbhB/YbcL family protein
MTAPLIIFMEFMSMTVANPKTAQAFSLASTEVQPDTQMPQRFEFNDFGANGDNESPELHWTGAPADAQSFAVTCYDPDAPTGSGWWHWLVVDIPANVRQLAPNAGAVGDARLPQGATHVRMDFGYAGWGGLCPPPGDKPHRYIFTVFALNTAKLPIPQDATAALAGFMIGAHKIASATFTAPYAR